ncbi:nucleotidyltransferase family protein [Fusobacterium varium]|uniref:nucleotidyltransferase family protein n=1 Tax=Fusobacterium varium TaxID=856 RepID=UPI001F175974|nr:nucleotidyltransferase family protein [Fusobacterium varium]MCF2674262.1 nucleotidyltransferase family protein [Fusobacterium varium]
MEAIILAGGFGTRLSHIVSDVPKPMAPINGIPFLNYILEYLLENGITRVILAVGYKKEIIKEYYRDKYKNIEIIYSEENTPLGTGGAIKQALGYTKEESLFIINGDTYFNVDLKEMYRFHKISNSNLTLAVKYMENFDRYGVLKIEEDRIIEFMEKQKTEKGEINGGIYLIDKGKFIFPKEENFSFEEYLSNLINGNIYAFKSDRYFIDIGIPEDYYRMIKKLNIN